MASPQTSAPVQNLLFQLPVPLAMGLSKLVFPRTRGYVRGQYIGATVIVVGAIISILPQLIHPPPPEENATGTSASAPDNNVGSVLLYLAGVAWYSIGSVYKEWALKKAPTVDYWYMSVAYTRHFCVGVSRCVCCLPDGAVFFSPLLTYFLLRPALLWCCRTLVENWWCFLLGFPMIPFLWIPGVGRDTPSTTWPHFKAGAKCMFLGVSDLDPDAKCDNLLSLCFVWILCNVIVNVLGLSVCRRGDAVLYSLVNSIQLPLSNMMYASAFIMTAALATQFDQAMWVGLMVVSAGFVCYQFMPLEGGKWFVGFKQQQQPQQLQPLLSNGSDGEVRLASLEAGAVSSLAAAPSSELVSSPQGTAGPTGNDTADDSADRLHSGFQSSPPKAHALRQHLLQAGDNDR
jgi:hypothetical protein